MDPQGDQDSLDNIALDGMTLTQLQKMFLWRYVDLQPLPEGFPDPEGRLQSRLQQGWTRGVIVCVGTPLLPQDIDPDNGSWGEVEFEVADSEGIADDLLPLKLFKEVSPGERADPAQLSVRRQHSGLMRIGQNGTGLQVPLT